MLTIDEARRIAATWRICLELLGKKRPQPVGELRPLQSEGGEEEATFNEQRDPKVLPTVRNY